jgi:hypothetical protein
LAAGTQQALLLHWSDERRFRYFRMIFIETEYGGHALLLPGTYSFMMQFRLFADSVDLSF